ncbi:metal-dependent transcriptional regulator [Clostridium uliginosum]|uniref:Mn-dependent transcriptional regulator, DtxR family n=1 Tax=Clostridium uliginosum TaxID=119641 RepID=A0A1I1RDM7_9CLOT|nr:metal-dependent transcriptional regulator [Clostridium uliginosum]SFD29683.1 Mn-dependent transcriptional regulator, DtxR family [Clostridium uliginosum]
MVEKLTSHESKENYLETILILENEKGVVRSIDIARKLNYSKPSVSRAVKLLKELGYIEMNNEALIRLTENGRKKAETIYEKHKILTEFFEQIAGVEPEIAEEDACKIEHIISNETYNGLKKYLYGTQKKL